MNRRRLSALAPLLVAAVALPQSEHLQGSRVEGDVTVFAAASLTDSFTEIAAEFEAVHPDAEVVLNFAASSQLATQIDEGAPADVYASADHHNMERLVDAARTDGVPATFATNELAIIVEPDNPLGIGGLADLDDPDLIVVMCDPAVPIGAYTQQLFEAARVDMTPDSLEEDVRGIVGKVVAGEADAGVVYVTDISAAGDNAEGVAIPDDVNVVASYPIVATAEAPNPDGAAAFVQFVLGDQGQAILADIGFGPPDAATDG
ncbi:MAG: molybdate ABC transporter substrate-binding protein [Acidimicrobiales bacterium]